MILPIEISELKRANSPQAHGGGRGEPGLIISFIEKPNLMCSLAGRPCFLISDWAGYITATTSERLIAELVRLEALGGAGTVRELLTGVPKILGEEPPIATAEAFPSLEDLIG